jgi:hypothetical protein
MSRNAISFFLLTHSFKRKLLETIVGVKEKLFSTSQLLLFNFNLLRIFAFGSCGGGKKK